MTGMGQFVHRILFLTACVCIAMPAMAQYSAFEDPSSANASAASSSFEFGPAKAEIDGGDIPTGQTTQVIVMMRNNTGAPITLKSIDLVPSSNVTAAISGNQCGKEPVKPNIECPVTVSLKAEAGGKYRVGMLINHDGRSRVSNVAIVGNNAAGAGSASGQPANEIEAFPNEVDFGTAKGRAPLVRSITLRNTSTKAIDISSIDLIASPLTGFSVSAPNCKELQASQSCVATVTWTPSVEGGSEGVLAMTHTGPSGSLQISLKGEYQITKTEKVSAFPTLVPGQGLIVADRESVDFGSTVDGAASITVSLVNGGDKPVNLKQVKLAGSDNGLSLSQDDCTSGKTLAANQGCALTVNWFPRRAGPVIDDIQIIHDGARGVLVLPVRGTATQTVSANLPVLTSGIPKLGKESLDEGIVGKGDTGAKGGVAAAATNTASLNGYRVTSLSANKAVITGPNGRMIVENGKPHIIANGQWKPKITPDGVELIGDTDSVFLLFDRSLGGANSAVTETEAKAFPASSQPSSLASYSSNSSSSSSSSSGSGSSSPFARGNQNNNGMNSGMNTPGVSGSTTGRAY